MNNMVTRTATWYNGIGVLSINNSNQLLSYTFLQYVGIPSSPLAQAPGGNTNSTKQYPWHQAMSFQKGAVVKGYSAGTVVKIKVPAELAAGVMGSIFIEIPASYLKEINLSQGKSITLKHT